MQILAIIIFLPMNAWAQSDPPVHFTADRLDHDDREQVITAHGDVELIQENQILHADQIVYNLQSDIVTAIGNVSLLDENGQVHFAEYLQLSDQMKSGFVHGLTSYLTDGSRFQAAEAERINNTRIVMKNASYTPCKICASHPEKDPTWQIKADEVSYDEVKGSVKYKNAHLEVLGIPLAYTPIFSHPDPRIEQKSGFLRPGFGWNSELGTFAEGTYYWGIDMNRDATLSIRPSAKQGVLVKPEYRQHFERGYIKFTPSVAFGSDRTKTDGTIDDDLTRAHIEGEGRIDFNDKWRGGFDLMRSSDKEYLRLYDISSENVLQNILYAERFDGRNYTNINAQQYQDVRLNITEDQPDVLPSMSHSMIGAPESFLGGRWSADFSALGLRRNGDGQDVNRLSSEIGWRHDYISDFGLSTVTTASGRMDYYNARDLDSAAMTPGAEDEVSEVRFFPQIHSEISYPLVKNAVNKQYVIEPKAGFAIGSHANEEDIPNEDSRDIQLDALNLFEPNRFPGNDLQDTGTRVTYGLGGGIHYHDGAQVKGFIGQSYRFDDDNLFPAGSGLSENRSDYVGSLRVNLYDPDVFLDYRTQLNESSLAPQRHELQGYARFGDVGMRARYTFTKAVGGTGFTSSREQLDYGIDYQLNDNWVLSGSALMDLGEEPGLRRASTGLLYTDDCFNFNIVGERRITDRSSGESETTLLMRVGFKYLGELSAPHILLAAEPAE